MIYTFERIDDSLPLLPLAARRALDLAGIRLSLQAWKAMPLHARRAVVAMGTDAQVDTQKVQRALLRVKAKGEPCPVRPDPDPSRVPAEVTQSLGYDIGVPTWGALTPLDRYAIAKIAGRPSRERLEEAYGEIVLVPEIGIARPDQPVANVRRPRTLPPPSTPLSSHVSPEGVVRMVDVGQKEATSRRAVALARVTMEPETAARLREGHAGKGDVLATARVAGIQAAKKTSDLIPLCHTVSLTQVAVDIELEASAVVIRASSYAYDRTGVEMEAMVAASAAALTVYDMLKGVDRAMSFDVRLLEKEGGRSGYWTRPVR
jgi:cyclic pyranopterin phosphate synthase